MRNVTAFVPDGVAITVVAVVLNATIRLDGISGVVGTVGIVYDRMIGPAVRPFDPSALSSTSIVRPPVGIP